MDSICNLDRLRNINVTVTTRLVDYLTDKREKRRKENVGGRQSV